MDPLKVHKNPYLTPRSDKVRLIALIIVTVIVITAFFYFRIDSQQKQESYDQDEYTYAPPVREVYAKVDPARLADVEDDNISDRVVKEMDPYLHLIKESAKILPGDMELLGAKIADIDAVRADPAAFRGKPLSIKGNLQWWETEQFQDFELFRGYMTTLEGDHVYFTVLGMPDDVALGDVFRLNGFFFKIFSFLLPQDDTRVSDAVFLVGRRLITSFYDMDPVTEVNVDLLDTITDYQLEGSLVDFQEKPLFHLLSYVQTLDDEAYAAIEFPEHLAMKIRSRPSEFRGQPVDVVGQLVWLRQTLLGPEGENPLGIPKVHRGILYNHRGKFCYFFALDVPEWLKPEMRELVHLKGFFFRNYSWETREGATVSAPTLVVRGFEKYVIPEDNTMFYVTLFIFGLTIVIVGFFFISVFQDRKRAREYRSRFIAKKKQLLREAMASDSGLAGDAGKAGGPDRPAGD